MAVRRVTMKAKSGSREEEAWVRQSVFGGLLSTEELSALKLQKLTKPRGALVCRSGCEVDGVYLLVQGSCRLTDDLTFSEGSSSGGTQRQEAQRVFAETLGGITSAARRLATTAVIGPVTTVNLASVMADRRVMETVHVESTTATLLFLPASEVRVVLSGVPMGKVVASVRSDCAAALARRTRAQAALEARAALCRDEDEDEEEVRVEEESWAAPGASVVDDSPRRGHVLEKTLPEDSPSGKGWARVRFGGEQLFGAGEVLFDIPGSAPIFGTPVARTRVEQGRKDVDLWGIGIRLAQMAEPQPTLVPAATVAQWRANAREQGKWDGPPAIPEESPRRAFSAPRPQTAPSTRNKPSFRGRPSSAGGVQNNNNAAPFRCRPSSAGGVQRSTGVQSRGRPSSAGGLLRSRQVLLRHREEENDNICDAGEEGQEEDFHAHLSDEEYSGDLLLQQLSTGAERRVFRRQPSSAVLFAVTPVRFSDPREKREWSASRQPEPLRFVEQRPRTPSRPRSATTSRPSSSRRPQTVDEENSEGPENYYNFPTTFGLKEEVLFVPPPRYKTQRPTVTARPRRTSSLSEHCGLRRSDASSRKMNTKPLPRTPSNYRLIPQNRRKKLPDDKVTLPRPKRPTATHIIHPLHPQEKPLRFTQSARIKAAEKLNADGGKKKSGRKLVLNLAFM